MASRHRYPFSSFGVLCGCYYHVASEKSYLPRVKLQAHTTILRTTSETTLEQTFSNTSGKPIKECIYTFPLSDGVSVVGFTCETGDRTIRGIVKERREAKATYDKAVSRGETAGLLQQLPEASDAFSTSLGNIPAGGEVLVIITYVSELKHDAEADGIRFTLPTKIAPRYGNAPLDLTKRNAKAAEDVDGISITVDIDVGVSSHIIGVNSPSHLIAFTMGKTSASSGDDLVMSRASATLALAQTHLDDDFVLIVSTKDNGMPTAFLETHSTIPKQRALMVDLVPKFSLPPGRPEIVFVADRSGSMQWQIPTLISALKVFLKSLPVGVKFNILSFGSSHSFLWPKSKTYDRDSLNAASTHVEHFAANMGGTETFAAIKAAIENRYADLSCEIMLLTDGDIWSQDSLFSYLNQVVGNNIRVFTLGIGGGVSSALINGIARAGKGFAQTVANGEKMDKKVVRMLKGALSPHICDYTMEVKYEHQSDRDQDMEWDLVEKVEEKLKVTDNSESEKNVPTPEQKPISLYDADKEMDEADTANPTDSKFLDTGDPFKDVPEISTPKLLQAPHTIPPLFPFSRTTVYLLMTPECAQANPKSVILRGTSPQGPLELEIPVQILPGLGKKIHQLAAKKAMQDLEEHRGWLYSARNEKTNALLENEYASCFDQMVQREAVRLGVKYQVGGKYCSFVAVAENEESSEHLITTPSESDIEDEDEGFGSFGAESSGNTYYHERFEATGSAPSKSKSRRRGPSAKTPGSAPGAPGGMAFFCSTRSSYPSARYANELDGKGGFSGARGGRGPTPPTRSRGGAESEAVSTNNGPAMQTFGAPPSAVHPASMSVQSFSRTGGFKKKKAVQSQDLASPGIHGEAESTLETDSDKIHALIELQDFEGYWSLDDKLLAILGLKAHMIQNEDASVTALVIYFLEQRMGSEKDLWELVVDKANEWLVGKDADVEALEKEAKEAFEKYGN
ncbi:hypothetical protein P7C71_g2127, partial [Lecanoromycetidae sp. Uapishka_2]